MSASSSSSNTPSVGSPTKPFQAISKPRLPLAELPVVNFVGRPSSPVKTHSSPTKSSKLLPSPKVGRTSAGQSIDSPFQSRSNTSIKNFGDTSPNVQDEEKNQINKPFLTFQTSPSKTLADLPIEQSPVISDEIRHAKHSPAAKLREKFRDQEVGLSSQNGSPGKKEKYSSLQQQERSPRIIQRKDEHYQMRTEDLVTPPLELQRETFDGPSISGVPQSLPRKKDRVRASEIAHLVMDQDEDRLLDVGRGSPSPSKSTKQSLTASPLQSTPSKINDGFVVPTSSANKGIEIGLGIDHPLRVTASPKPAITWTVLPDAVEENANDSDNRSENEIQTSFNDPAEADKENLKPDPVIMHGRKKGTGGRLSLVATAAQAEDANTSNETTMTSVINRQD